METPLIIVYTPQRSDYIRASRALAMKTRTFQVLGGIILLVIILSALVLASPWIGNSTWNTAAFIGLLVGMFYVLFYLIVIPFQLSKAYKTKDHMRMPRQISFTDMGIAMTMGDRTFELAWERVQKAIDGGDFYLLINKGETRIYPFVPRRAFKDENMHAAFLDLLQAKSIPMI